MSVKLLRESLTVIKSEEIMKTLEFVPRMQVALGATRSGTSNGISHKVVSCFTSNEDEPFIRVPLMYASLLWGMNNDMQPHDTIEGERKIEPYKVQLDTMLDVLLMLQKHRTCSIKSKPGSGKTIMSLMIALSLKLRTVVLVHSLTLVGQWMNAIADFTTCTSWVADKKDFIQHKPDFIVCHIRRWKILSPELRDTVGLVIIDECPLHCNQYGANALLSFSPKYILGLSATPTRSRDGMYIVMEQFIGKHVIEQENFVSIDLLKVETTFVANRVKIRDGVSWSKLIQSLLYNIERNSLIIDVVVDYLSQGYKVMMLTTECKHVEELSRMLTARAVAHDTFYGVKKTYNDSPVLVANSQKASVGFDESGTSCIGFDGIRINCVIFCSSIASAENIIQSAGRGFRSSVIKPCVVHFVDNDSTIKKHFETALTAYDTYGYKLSMREIQV